MDYCFIRETAGEDYSVVLVGKERETKLIMAHVVPCKGAEIDWVAEQVCRDLKKFGIRGDMNFKIDQEPALVDLVNKICGLRPESRTVVTHSSVGDSKGNGLAERAVQQVEEMIRVHKLAVETRIKAKLACVHPLMAWLVEHAADVLNRYGIGKDGRTPYQRLKGRKFVGNMLEFGSPVMFRVSGKVAGGIMQERWFPGIWVGKKLHTDQHLVMKEDGLVVRSRAVRETSQELTLADYDKLKSTPHDPLGAIRSAIVSSRPPVPLRDEKEEVLDYRPRRAKLTKDVVERYGFTAGCPKCRSWEQGEVGSTTIGHSAKCRERLEDLMKEDPVFKERLDRAETRINETLARYVEAHDPHRQGGPVKRARGDLEEHEHRDAEGDQDMGVPEAAASPVSVPPVPSPVAVGASSSSVAAAASRSSSSVPAAGSASNNASWEQLAARIKRGPEPLQAEPRPQRPRIELVDFTVDAGARVKFRGRDSGECLKTLESHRTSQASIGMLHWRGGELPEAPGVKVAFCLDCDGHDAVERQDWDFRSADARSAFVESVSRKGPDLCWVKRPHDRPHASVALSVEVCRAQARRGKAFLLEAPGHVGAEEAQLFHTLVHEGIGQQFLMHGTEVISNWSQLRAEYSGKEPCVDKAVTTVIKLLETQRLHSLEHALMSVLEEEEGPESSTLQDPVIPWVMEEQWDELTGKVLDLEKVVKGRLKELKKFEERRVYTHVSRNEAMHDRAGKFVKTRWVQTVKGDDVRCRLVAQEFAHGDPREDLFAGTPPLFAARLLVSRTATRRPKKHTLMVLDVSCAFLYAPIKRTVYIELPEEDQKSQTGEWVGKLEKALYGT